jgi:hypothetical protein
MSTAASNDWRKEFGVAERKPPCFYSSVEELNAAGDGAVQPLALRRAFEQLDLDGILCLDRNPVIYFRQVDQIDRDEVAGLHRVFWSQGVAPILVLVAPEEVHVYSGLAQPALDGAQAPGFVETIDRVSERLRAFILSVESGEYFHAHRKSFDPRQRVDRELLRNLEAVREDLSRVQAARLAPGTLDSLLCRLVFACYLFDRGVIDRSYLEEIGIGQAEHLRDVLGRQPRTEAKADLYTLFAQLAEDFNGDLFSDDLESEARQVRVNHLEIVDRFFHGTDVRTRQRSFWPYDFGIIPIETISAIYEHFLKAAGEKERKASGAFYTPRFLAELVLDMALEGASSLLEKRFLDPACGSGIFLVGLFNRLAEEWKRAHPTARYDRQATGLMRLLTENLYGVDSNPTACRITAFSLYLAFLDQLSPSDIRRLQRRGKILPPLNKTPEMDGDQGHTIRHADFFTPEGEPSAKAHFVVGNPPWASNAASSTPAGRWCAAHDKPLPDKQLATAFVWKAPEHLEAGGRVCLVLPYGTLFKHSRQALDFQRQWVRCHAIERVLNVADYQRFLFEKSEAPALVVRYVNEKPANAGHRIEYLAPKADWAVTQAQLITVLPQDRARVTVREVLTDLSGEDAPQIWKQRFWVTPRDRRLLDRLSLMPRLRALVGHPSRRQDKRWLIAEGYQPLGENDDPERASTLRLPSRRFVDATSAALSLLLLRNECRQLPSPDVEIREKSNKNTEVYRAPHVLVTKGLSRIAFADFDVAFRHAVRGIHGPSEDRDLLVFLTTYLRSALARYFLFHTSSNWGVSRQKVHVEELLRLPFPLPHEADDPDRARQIVSKVARIVSDAVPPDQPLVDRDDLVRRAQAQAEELVEEYFDVDDIERMLIADTTEIVIPSVRPTRDRLDVPTIVNTSNEQRQTYTRLLCNTLSAWASREYEVHGRPIADGTLGIGLVVLEKVRRGKSPRRLNESTGNVMAALDRLQRGAAKRFGSLELARGLKVFDGNSLYITKPLSRRFWTRTAALNDADEIAGTILTRPARRGA